MTAQGIPYSYKDIDVQPGTSLIFIAQENSSTIQTIQEHNKLTKVMIINNSQKLSIPYIK